MRLPVHDALVQEYAARLRAGGPLGQVFPDVISKCEFTAAQREVIRHARLDRRAADKKSKPASAAAVKPASPATAAASPAAKPTQPKGQTKLSKMLYLQSGRCFFCGEPLGEADASIEHLNPRSRGGKSTEDNIVVCHKFLNETFGDMDLKRKFAFVLKSPGSFKCPRK